MTYGPGPTATTRYKPSRWNVNVGLVPPEWQWAWDELQFAVVAWEGSSTPVDIIRNVPLNTANQPSWTATERGIGLGFDGTNDYLASAETRQVVPATGDFTLVVLASVNSGEADNNAGVSCGTETGTLGNSIGDIILYLNSTSGSASNQVRWFWRPDDGTGSLEWVGSDIRGTGLRLVTAVAKRSSSEGILYLDGEVDDSGSFAEPERDPSSKLWIGAAPDSSPGSGRFFLGGQVGMVAIYARALTAAEIQQLARDPFAPFRPNWDYTTAAAVTLTAAGVTETETPGTATLTTAVILSAAGVTETETVGTATISTSVVLAAAGVTETETPGTATLTTAVILSPSGVTETETAGTATLSTAVILTAAGVAETETVGSATLTTTVILSTSGVTELETVGTATLTASTDLTAVNVVTSVETWTLTTVADTWDLTVTVVP